MKIRGDIESVNLSTGERYQRVSGDGESRLEIVGKESEEMASHRLKQAATQEFPHGPVSERFMRHHYGASGFVKKEKQMENETPATAAVNPLPKPSIGRIVIFHFQASDINLNNGLLIAPAIITAVWSDTCVNLKVLADNPHDQWKTSASFGEGPGQWSWPPRV